MAAPPGVRRGLVLLGAAMLAGSGLGPAAAQDGSVDPDAGARIGVRVIDGDAEFYRVATGETWVPRGSNLLRFDRGGAESLMAPGSEDWDWLESRMQALEDGGYNAIRVFFEMCVGDRGCTGGSGERLSDAFLDNVVRYVRMAADHELHVLLSSNTLPSDSWYIHNGFGEGESEFLTPLNVQVHQQFFSDLVTGLVDRHAPVDWIWGIEIRNEFHYDGTWLPWSWAEGTFTAANGQTYDMSKPRHRERLSSEGLLHWADEMTKVIKGIDPDLLVAIGMLMPEDNVRHYGPDDPRLLVIDDFYDRTIVDLFDVHGIKDPKDFERDWNLTRSRGKPIIAGEFAGEWSTPDIVAWAATWYQALSCQDGFDGWLTWHWEWVAGSLIDETLSPRNAPDPCVRVPVEVQQVSWGKPVKASRSEARRYGPRFLVDDDPESYWSAADGGPQWAEIDLQEVVDIGSVRLPIGIVTPIGPADIKVLVRGPGTKGKLRQVHRFKRKKLQPGDVLEVAFDPPLRRIRRVRIRVEDMNDDWVILHDVEVWRALEPASDG